MKFYLGDRFLFIDMYNRYTHAVIQGDDDRVLCCRASLAYAEDTRMDIINHKTKILNAMKDLLKEGPEFVSKKICFGVDLKKLYPTYGLLATGIKQMERQIESIRVVPLTVTE